MDMIADVYENQNYQGLDVLIVKCQGRIILSDELGEFRERVKALIPKSCQIVLDLGDVNYIDSAGLGTLVGLYTSARSANCNIKLAKLNKRVKDLLQITKLLTVFEVYEDEDKAVSSFRKKAA
jgi:anti-sigma B factor antagonist